MTEFLVLVMAAVVALCFGFLLGVSEATKRDRDEAVEHGCAQYNSQTAEFEWKDELP